MLSFWKIFWKSKENINQFVKDDVGNYSQSHGIESLALQKIIREAYTTLGVPLHWNANEHWNYEGHELVAIVLANKLKSIIHFSERK